MKPNLNLASIKCCGLHTFEKNFMVLFQRKLICASKLHKLPFLLYLPDSVNDSLW